MSSEMHVAGQRLNIGVTRIDPTLPFYKDMDRYILVKSRCLKDYHIDLDWKIALEDTSHHLTRNRGSSTVDAAYAGNPEAILDLAVRYLSGCGRPNKSPEGALFILDAFLHPESREMPYIGGFASTIHMAKAHSLAIHAYLDKILATPAERAAMEAEGRALRRLRPATAGPGLGPETGALAVFADFVAALHHANESAQRGLVSAAVLRVAFMLRDVGASLGVDLAQAVRRSRRYHPVWRVLTRRLEEIHDEERKRQRKKEREPLAYACAAEGCGIRAEGRAALRACAGSCPADLKPRYCSMSCQRKDWPRHKEVCKPGSESKPFVVTSGMKAQVLALFELGNPGDGEDEAEEDSPSGRAGLQEDVEDESDSVNASSEPCPPGPGRTIDFRVPGVPGGSMCITSDTLDAAMLKDICKELTKLMRGDAMD